MEEELIKIWQSSPNQERIKFEKSRLILDVQSSLDNFHKKIKFRDLREQLAALIVIPIFAYSFFVIPPLLTKVASILGIGYAVYVIFRLRNAKKHKPGTLTDSYLEYLKKSSQYLLIQKQLLESVIYWYILPGITVTMLFFMGFGIAGRIKPILKMAAVNVLLAVVTFLLNKRVVKIEIIPRIGKVDELIRALEKP